jgi:hypothetical protein
MFIARVVDPGTRAEETKKIISFYSTCRYLCPSKKLVVTCLTFNDDFTKIGIKKIVERSALFLLGSGLKSIRIHNPVHNQCFGSALTYSDPDPAF